MQISNCGKNLKSSVIHGLCKAVVQRSFLKVIKHTIIATEVDTSRVKVQGSTTSKHKVHLKSIHTVQHPSQSLKITIVHQRRKHGG